MDSTLEQLPRAVTACSLCRRLQGRTLTSFLAFLLGEGLFLEFLTPASTPLALHPFSWASTEHFLSPQRSTRAGTGQNVEQGFINVCREQGSVLSPQGHGSLVGLRLFHSLVHLQSLLPFLAHNLPPSLKK